MNLGLIKLFLPVVLTFLFGVLITPILTKYFYKFRMWKRSPRTENNINKGDEERVKGGVLPEDMSKDFQRVHNTEEELRTPRVGGSIIWLSIILSSIFLFLLATFFPNEITQRLNFISKNQTLLPFIALILGSLWGLADDLMTIYVTKGKFANGFPRKYMLSFVLVVAIAFGLWFFLKLDYTAIKIPILNQFIELGWLIVPVFVLIMLGSFSSGVIDGIDGLAGGVMATVFASIATIAFFQNQIDIAAFSGVLAGAILSFLWFNIPPARFYMGETGMLGLTLCLTVLVFLTDTVLLLPVIGLPLVVTSLSSFLQIIGKKIWGPEKGKIIRVAPIHHHFEAIGWSRAKITMRYWIISVIAGVTGIIIALL